MSSAARIEDGVVVEVIDLPDGLTVANAFHPDAGFVPAEVAVKVGMHYLGGEFLPPAEPEPSAPALAEYRRAIQAHVDEAAQSHSYDSALTCATYVGSTNPVWAAEAQAFVAWRDAVWVHAYAELDKVEAGARPQPSIEAFLQELPALIWPAA